MNPILCVGQLVSRPHFTTCCAHTYCFLRLPRRAHASQSPGMDDGDRRWCWACCCLRLAAEASVSRHSLCVFPLSHCLLLCLCDALLATGKPCLMKIDYCFHCYTATEILVSHLRVLLQKFRPPTKLCHDQQISTTSRSPSPGSRTRSVEQAESVARH